MDNHRVQYITRGDFSSDASWEKFLNFARIQKSKLINFYNKKSRKENKLKSLSGIISDLKQKQECVAAEFLQVDLYL